MLNGWAIVLLLAAAQGIILSLALLIQSKKRDRSNIFLALILLIISLELLNTWGMQVRYHHLPTAIPFWLVESYFVLPASLHLFLRSNTQANFQFSRKQWLLYVPALIEIGVETATYVYNHSTGNIIYLLNIPAWWIFTELMPVIWMSVVLYQYGRALISKLQQTKVDFTPSRLHQVKLYSVFITLTVITLCWLGEVVAHLKIFVIVEVVATIALFSLAYAGYAIPAFFDMRLVTLKPVINELSFPNYNDQHELIRLTDAFEKDALHLRTGLTLEALASELKLPVKYVSYLINTHHQSNFHQFINVFRVKEVIRKMQDPTEHHKTLLALATESGFSSKSSFNQVFKSHTGKTPSQYLK